MGLLHPHMQGMKGNPLWKFWFLVLPEQVVNLADAELLLLKNAQNYLDISLQRKIYCYFIVFPKSHFCHIAEWKFRKGASALGRNALLWELKAKGLHVFLFLPSVCRVLPRRANRLLPGRHSPPVWRHEGTAANHLPCRATAAEQNVWQGELHFDFTPFGTMDMSLYHSCGRIPLVMEISKADDTLSALLQTLSHPVEWVQLLQCVSLYYNLHRLQTQLSHMNM